MAETHKLHEALIFSCLLLSMAGVACSVTFTLVNQCSYAVWPGILSDAGTPQLPSTGFLLGSGESFSINMPASWSGRLWGRTFCTQDPTTGRFSCATGDCSSGNVECGGNGAVPPATLVEFTLDGSGGLDFYDVSLVDGFNLPLLVVPQTGGNCTYTGCAADINAACPSELKVVGGGDCVACRSACEAFGEPRYCCSGDHGTPESCGPSEYSELFKKACPRAYSYAYDDGSSTFTCATQGDYVVTFCPSLSARNDKSREEDQEIAPSRVSFVSSAAPQFTSVPIIFVAVMAVLLTRPNAFGPPT